MSTSSRSCFSWQRRWEESNPLSSRRSVCPRTRRSGVASRLRLSSSSFVLKQWDTLGIRIRFLSWFSLYDWFYEETLKVALTSPTVEDSPIYVVASQSDNKTYTAIDGTTQPFWGAAHDIPQQVLGPKAPGNTLAATNADRVYWINQSTTPGTAAEQVARYYGSGLMRADGTPKPAWDVLQKELTNRRKQKVFP